MRVVVVSTFTPKLMMYSLIWLSLFRNVAHSGTVKHFRMEKVQVPLIFRETWTDGTPPKETLEVIGGIWINTNSSITW